MPEGEAFNQPVLFTGVGLLFVAPSLGQFYSGAVPDVRHGRARRSDGHSRSTRSRARLVRSAATPPVRRRRSSARSSRNAYPLLGIAAIAFIGGVWYDALDAGDAAIATTRTTASGHAADDARTAGVRAGRRRSAELSSYFWPTSCVEHRVHLFGMDRADARLTDPVPCAIEDERRRQRLRIVERHQDVRVRRARPGTPSRSPTGS